MLSYEEFCKILVDDVVKDFGYSAADVEAWIEDNNELVKGYYNDGVRYYKKNGDREKAFAWVVNDLGYLIHMEI